MKLRGFDIRLALQRISARARSWSAGLRTEGAHTDEAGFKHGLMTGLKYCQAVVLVWRTRVAQASGSVIRPERLSAWVSFVFLILTLISVAYWGMRFAQVLFPQQVSAKGVIFYEAASNLRVRTLFGEKDFDPSRLILRGVVLTGEINGVNQGMALLELDGNTAETLELGDMMSPGIRLEKITPDSAVVRYRGRSYELQQSLAGGSGY